MLPSPGLAQGDTQPPPKYCQDTAQGDKPPCFAQNFLQNHPLVHLPSLFLGVECWENVTEFFCKLKEIFCQACV